jgi:hypothetical protein
LFCINNKNEERKVQNRNAHMQIEPNEHSLRENDGTIKKFYNLKGMEK